MSDKRIYSMAAEEKVVLQSLAEGTPVTFVYDSITGPIFLRAIPHRIFGANEQRQELVPKIITALTVRHYETARDLAEQWATAADKEAPWTREDAIKAGIVIP